MAQARSILIFLCANAIAIIVASLYLGPGFQLGFMSFFVAVLVFTAVEAAAKPLLARAARKWLPQMIGALSLVAVFVSLLVTSLIVPGKVISGIGNWFAATLIVWLVSFVAQLALAKWAFPEPPAGGAARP